MSFEMHVWREEMWSEITCTCQCGLCVCLVLFFKWSLQEHKAHSASVWAVKAGGFYSLSEHLFSVLLFSLLADCHLYEWKQYQHTFSNTLYLCLSYLTLLQCWLQILSLNLSIFQGKEDLLLCLYKVEGSSFCCGHWNRWVLARNQIRWLTNIWMSLEAKNKLRLTLFCFCFIKHWSSLTTTMWLNANRHVANIIPA